MLRHSSVIRCSTGSQARPPRAELEATWPRSPRQSSSGMSGHELDNSTDCLPVKALSPLMRLALQTGSVAGVGARLRAGDAVNAREPSGRTPLMLAAVRGHADVCRLLLDNGANALDKDASGLMAAQIASAAGHVELAALLEQVAAATSVTSGLPGDGHTLLDQADRATKVESDVSPDGPPIESGGAESGLVIPNARRAERSTADVGSQTRGSPRPGNELAAGGDSILPRPLDLEVVKELPAEAADIASAQPADEPGDAGWEAEPEAALPDADPSCIERAVEIQLTLSSHAAVDADMDWSEIDGALPAVFESATALRSDPELRRKLVHWLKRSAKDGFVDPSAVAEAIAGIGDSVNDYEKEATRQLLLCIEDAGAVADSEIPREWGWFTEPECDDDSDSEMDAAVEPWVDEAVSRIESAASGLGEPFWQWARDVGGAGPLLSHDDEMLLAQQIRSSIREAACTIYREEAYRQLLLDTVSACLERRGTGEQPDVDEEVSPGTNRVAAEFDPGVGTGTDNAVLVTLKESLSRASFSHDSADAKANGATLDAWLDRAAFGVVQLDGVMKQIDLAIVPRSVKEQVERQIKVASRARSQFAERNLRLVWAIAKRYVHSGVPLADLVQEGSIGLLRAVDGYDPGRGFRFSTYATWWIRQAVSRAVADKSRLVRVPVHMHERIRELEGASRRLSDQLGREPRAIEIAEATGWPQAEVLKVRRASVEVRSFDDPANAGWEGQVDASIDSPELPDERLEHAQRRDWLYAALSGLKHKDAMIVAMRAGLRTWDDRTLEEVGQAFEVTRERVRQIESKALGTLKKRLEATQSQVGPSADPRRAESQITPQPVEAGRSGDVAHEQQSQGSPASLGADTARAVQLETSEAHGDKLAGVLRLLASPSRQAGVSTILKVRSLQREMARRWFEVYPPEQAGDIYSGVQHAALQELTASLRGAVRILGLDPIDPQELMRTESWRMVIDAASDALRVLVDVEQSTNS